MEELDVLIVGAGLSGVAAGYHLQDKCPHKSYAIVEMRESMGGTWDLFRYPGIRSDSDMYTLGYSFRPWTENKSLAGGQSILNYIKETAEENGIDRNIRYQHKVVAASWKTEEQRWTVSIDRLDTGESETIRCQYVFMCSGYYDYESGFMPNFDGLDDFQGPVIHPQKWDETLDYTDKKIVVIGSGATAVTLVPALADDAQEVTMLQRSPTYIVSLPAVDPVAQKLQQLLPENMAYQITRWKNILISMGMYHFCQSFPKVARKLIRKGIDSQLDEHVDMDPHFQPWYNPWDQRLCLVPNADLFKSLNEGSARIATDHIDHFTADGIALESGRHLDADIIISATGLSLKFLAGLNIEVDGVPTSPSDVFPYKGVMLENIPNLGLSFGYVNASWTLKCELACKYFFGLVSHMDEHDYTSVVPTVSDPSMQHAPLIDMNSSYFKRAQSQLPDQGTKAPWKVHQNYLKDLVEFKVKDFDDGELRFYHVESADTIDVRTGTNSSDAPQVRHQA